MASVEEKSSKRKVDAIDPAKKKKKTKPNNKDEAKDDELSNIVNAITAKEATVMQTWKRVVADLEKAGVVVRQKDVREGEIVWEWTCNVYFKLRMTFSHDDESKDLVPHYEVYCHLDGTGKTQIKIFEASEWDQLMKHLIESNNKAEYAANCERLSDWLETEAEAWKDLISALDDTPSVPKFSSYSIEDGLVTLGWKREDKGFEVTVERRTQDSGDGDVYETFCVQKTPLKQNDASVVKSTKHIGYVHDVIDHVAKLLK